METRQSASHLVYNNLSSYHIDYGSLEVGKELGRGGFGVVYEGEYAFDKVAIKKLHSHLLSKEHLEEFEREAEVMTRLRHPRMVQLYGVCLRDPDYALVMEYMSKGSLAALLSSPKNIPWQQRYQIALDVGTAVAYLHHNSIVHCDLKSDNVLLDAHYRAKVTDFGISRLKNENSTWGTWTAGTWGWMAPELMGDNPRNTKEADVYAYGVVLWELGARKKPFEGLNVGGIVKRVCKGNREPISEDMPPQMAELVLDCWNQESQVRPTMPTALKFLKDRHLAVIEGLEKITSQKPIFTEEKPQKIHMKQASKDYSSETLIGAAQKCDLEAVKWLLVHGSSVREKEDEYGWTALLSAAWGGHLEVVRWLLANGSSLSEKNNGGFTALLFAAYGGHLEVVRWLLANGASLGEKSNGGFVALDFACKTGIHDSSSREGKGNWGLTALLCAAYGGHLEVVRWLLANGSSMGEKDNVGRTTLLCAAWGGHLEVVRWLLVNGASLGEKNNGGFTVLMCAAFGGHLEVVRWLLANGASVDEKTNAGKTAFDFAGKPEVKEFLKSYHPPIQLYTYPSRFIGNQSSKPVPQQSQHKKPGPNYLNSDIQYHCLKPNHKLS